MKGLRQKKMEEITWNVIKAGKRISIQNKTESRNEQNLHLKSSYITSQGPKMAVDEQERTEIRAC